MSTVRANTITNVAGTGGPTLTNGLTLGSSTLAAPPGTAPSFTCRAWVNFNGINATIRGSGNVSSITKIGTGRWNVNFATAMPDVNYTANVTGSDIDCAGGWVEYGTNPPTTTSLRVYNFLSDINVYQDADYMAVSVFR
jgi:hypothetical protein